MMAFGKTANSSPKTKAGERIYAIGDVHGRYDLLNSLLRSVIKHFQTSSIEARRVTILFLGDVIDRGPESARCLARVRHLVETRGAKMLLGNHEDMLLASLDANPIAQNAWLAHWEEMTTDQEQRIARPRQIYLGAEKRDFVPMKDR